MGRSQETFSKREIQNKKAKKRKEKALKRQERKENSGGSSLDDMIAYVDEYGRIVDTPPDPAQKKKTKLEDIDISVPRKIESDEPSIRTGIVSFFNEGKGFGFIRDLESRESIFVHVNNTNQPIADGNKVTFETEKGPKGLTAVNVSLSK